MGLDGKGNNVVAKPRRISAEETKEVDQIRVQPRLAPLKDAGYCSKKAPPYQPPSSKDELKKNSSPETTYVSTSKVTEKLQDSTQLPSPQKGEPQNLSSRKRKRQQISPLESNTEQPQNLTADESDSGDISDIWKRYDLSAIELTTADERAELEAVQKQIWKKRIFVPYAGIHTLPSS